MDWTSQDDIEGECAPTQLVPASQACDIAEESALEFNPDQSQDAWGAPESLDAWSAPSPVSPPRTAASPPRAEGWSPAPKAPTPPPKSPLPKAPSPVAVQSPKVLQAEPADLQNVTVKTITNELKAAFGGIKVKGARKALVKAAIVEALAQQAAPQESSESDDDEAPPSEARRLGFDDLVEDEEDDAPVAEEPVAEDDTEERPMNPYLYFSKLKRSEVRAEVDKDEAFAELSGGKRNAEATKRLGVLWKALSEEDKRRYKDEAPLIKCKKRKSTKKRKSSVEAADAPAFDPEVCRGVPCRPLRIAGKPASDPRDGHREISYASMASRWTYKVLRSVDGVETHTHRQDTQKKRRRPTPRSTPSSARPRTKARGRSSPRRSPRPRPSSRRQNAPRPSRRPSPRKRPPRTRRPRRNEKPWRRPSSSASRKMLVKRNWPRARRWPSL
jgi:hypothetical protein